MARSPHRPPSLVGKVFRGADAIRAGLLTKRQLRSSAWRQLLHGVYADTALPVDHVLLCRAAHLLIPPQAVFAGRSAATLHGVPYLGADDPVEVLTHSDLPRFRSASLIVRRAQLPESHVQVTNGLRCTTPERTCWDIARGAFGHDLVESVVYLDAMVRTGKVDTAVAFRRFGNVTPPPRGWARARQAYLLADGRAESPPESRLRVRLVLAGIPAPVPQYDVMNNGRWLARVDLAWPERRVAVEYDGHWHADPAQLRKDRRRLNGLISAGWTVLHVTDDRLRHDLDGLVAEIRSVL